MATEKNKCKRCKKREAEELRPILNRLNRVEGQLRGIRRMLENDEYCIDIMLQVSAASKALSAISRELLKTHIKTCVVEDLSKGKTETAYELAQTVEKVLR